MREPLYPYQAEGVRFLCSEGRAILADDMGLGKTRQAIEAMVSAEAFPALIVCPNTAKYVWKDELSKWAPSLDVMHVSGSPSQRAKRLLEVREVAILNYEALRVTPEVSSVKWKLVVFDEGHRLKNRKAQVSKLAAVLAKRIPSVYVLTGTPFMNRPDELWHLLHIVDPGNYRSYWRFVGTYCCVYQTPWGWEVKGLKNEEQLASEVSRLLLRRTKPEVGLQLPPLTTQTVVLELGKEQRRLYDQMAQEMLVEFEDGEELAAPIVLAKLTRLRQLAVSPRLLNNDAPEGSKYEAIREMLEGGSQKAVVYSNFANAIRQVAAMFESSAVITGREPTAKRAEAVRNFQAGDLGMLGVSIGAGGEAISLTEADVVVFLDRDWTPARNDQAVARCTRIGQRKPLHVVHLVSKDTIDEAMVKLLRYKGDLFHRILEKKAIRRMVEGKEVT